MSMHNTNLEMETIVDIVEECDKPFDVEELSEDLERPAYHNLYGLCKRFVEVYEIRKGEGDHG